MGMIAHTHMGVGIILFGRDPCIQCEGIVIEGVIHAGRVVLFKEYLDVGRVQLSKSEKCDNISEN